MICIEAMESLLKEAEDKDVFEHKNMFKHLLGRPCKFTVQVVDISVNEWWVEYATTNYEEYAFEIQAMLVAKDYTTRIIKHFEGITFEPVIKQPIVESV